MMSEYFRNNKLVQSIALFLAGSTTAGALSPREVYGQEDTADTQLEEVCVGGECARPLEYNGQSADGSAIKVTVPLSQPQQEEAPQQEKLNLAEAGSEVANAQAEAKFPQPFPERTINPNPIEYNGDEGEALFMDEGVTDQRCVDYGSTFQCTDVSNLELSFLEKGVEVYHDECSTIKRVCTDMSALAQVPARMFAAAQKTLNIGGEVNLDSEEISKLAERVNTLEEALEGANGKGYVCLDKAFVVPSPKDSERCEDPEICGGTGNNNYPIGHLGKLIVREGVDDCKDGQVAITDTSVAHNLYLTIKDVATELRRTKKDLEDLTKNLVGSGNGGLHCLDDAAAVAAAGITILEDSRNYCEDGEALVKTGDALSGLVNNYLALSNLIGQTEASLSERIGGLDTAINAKLGDLQTQLIDSTSICVSEDQADRWGVPQRVIGGTDCQDDKIRIPANVLTFINKLVGEDHERRLSDAETAYLTLSLSFDYTNVLGSDPNVDGLTLTPKFGAMIPLSKGLYLDVKAGVPLSVTSDSGFVSYSTMQDSYSREILGIEQQIKTFIETTEYFTAEIGLDTRIYHNTGDDIVDPTDDESLTLDVALTFGVIGENFQKMIAEINSDGTVDTTVLNHKQTNVGYGAQAGFTYCDGAHCISANGAFSTVGDQKEWGIGAGYTFRINFREENQK
jgi:hypothetical protein